MRQQIFSLFILLFSAGLSAQNVGIGTTSPTAKLDIIGNVKISDGTQGADKILTSDAGGLAHWTNPPAPACFFFGTDQTLANNDFVGLGSSSSQFLRNSIVVPANCELSSIVFSIRNNVSNQIISATVWRQPLNGSPTQTALFASITDGFISYVAAANGSVQLQQGDLISVQLNWSLGGALSNGAVVSVTYK